MKKKRQRRKERKPMPKSLRILGLIFLVGLTVVMFFYILNLPIFDIKDVIVNGARMLSPDEIRALAGIPLSENLFFTKFSRAEDNLGKITAIKEFRFYRIPPATVLISIKEREPIATILFPKRSAIIDKEGYVINRNQNISLDIPNMAELPVITGIEEKSALNGDRVNQKVAHLISQVIVKLSRFLESERMKLELGGLKRVSLLLDDLLQVKIGDTEKISRKMAVFVALLPEIAGKWSQVEYVDVRYPDNPVIKYK